jgi:threonine dehydrogenase-like Zn-dependent dehydrogenase
MSRFSRFKNVESRNLAIPSEMLALVLSGKGFENLSLKRIPVSRPGPNQFLGRVDAVFACSSDGKLIESGKDHPLMAGWDPERWPVVIGHEGCITAVQIGANLKGRIRIGQTFALQPAINAGPINHLERYPNPESVNKVAVGYSLGGLFAEYILVQEEVIETDSLIAYDGFKIPYFAAAFSEPLSCVYSSQNQVPHIYKDGAASPRRVRLGLKEGGITLVLGAGPMGILHADMAMMHRPRAIVISEPLEERRQQARVMIAGKARDRGVGFVVTAPPELSAVLDRISQGRGADDCIAALGIAQIQQESLRYLAKGGIAVFFGGARTGESEIRVDTRRVHYDSISMVGSSGGDPSDVHSVMTLLESGEISPELYVRRVGGLDAALDLIKSIRAQEFFGKGLIYPHTRQPLFPVESWSGDEEAEFLDSHLP